MIKIKKINRPRNNNSQTVVNTSPAVEQITDYLPAVGDEVNGYTVGAVVDFIKGLKLGGVVIDIDTDGNIRFNGNIYATGFVSAMGAGTSDGGTASGGGIDESELWRILAGDANSRQILSQYLITALTPYLLTSSLQMLTIQRGGVTIGTYKTDTAKSINIELPTFAEVLNKPTTLAGYGITDAMTTTAINSSINAVSARVDTAQATANTAQATADSANSKVDNLQIGGRNYCQQIKGFSGVTSYNGGYLGHVYWRAVNTTNFAVQYITTSPLTKGTQYTLSAYVRSDATSGLSFRLSLRGRKSGNDNMYNIMTYAQNVTSDWQRVTVSGVIPVDGAENFQFFFKADSLGNGTYVDWCMPQVELGNKPTDYTPAPEDIINGNVASATRIQTARSLWGNSFDGTGDINNTLIFPAHTDSRHIELNNKYGLCFFAGSGTWASALNYYKIAGTTVMGYGCHGTNATLLYGYIGKDYNDNVLRLFPDNKVVIGAGTQATTYKPTHTLEVVGTIKGTTAFLGRLMIGYTTEDTNYGIKCDGRFYAGDDSEISGLLTVIDIDVSNNIKGQSLTILGGASITDLSCNIITSNTIKANIGIESNGYVSAMASSASDGRYKTDVQHFNSLSILQRFTFISYKWRPEAQLISSELHDNTTNYGVIAQDVDGIIDGLVYDAKTQAGTIKAVRYEKLIPIVAKGVQELNDEVTILRAENAKLKAEIDDIKKQIERLWNRQF